MDIEEARAKIRRAAMASSQRHTYWCAIMEAFCDLLQVDELDQADAAAEIADKYAQALMEQPSNKSDAT